MEMKLVETAFKLIHSGVETDLEIGVIMLLSSSPEWCVKHLPSYGNANIDPAPIRLKYRWGALDRTMFIKNEVGILIRAGYLQCRYLYQFNPSSMVKYEKINLDEL